jgi:hypothetical protein
MAPILQAAVEEPKPPNGNGEPTLTRFQQLAGQLKTAIGAVMAEIPQFEAGHNGKARSISAHQTVPPEFIGTVAASIDPQQIGANVFDPVDAQNVLQFVEAFRPLVDEAVALATGSRSSASRGPRPIQNDAIPPAMEGRDLLACAMTGSGKTAAFLLPILHRLIGKPRGTTRALVLTPTRELAAQIDEHLRDLAVHTPLSGAAVFGGVGMGPQEHAFRSGVDVIVATPGPAARSLPYAVREARRAEYPRARRGRPDARHGLPARHPPRAAHLPPKRQTLFFSATMPPPIVSCRARC